MGAIQRSLDGNTKLLRIKNDLKKQQRNLLIRRFFSNKSVLIGSIIMILLVILVFFAPLIAPKGPYAMEVTNRLQAPSSAHLLGTDNFGRDLLGRIAYGAQVSMGVGFFVAFLASLLGMMIGLYASYYRSLDSLLMRICDGLMAIPGILLAIALMAAFGAKTENVVLALSIVFTPHIARAVRSAALVVREQTYIEAMKALGAPSWRIIWLHIAPNTLSPLIVQATFIFADAIIIEAALSFLGAGVPAPAPSWGNILSDGKTVIFNAWWLTLFPGITIILSVLGLNLFGDGLRDLLDPHTNQAKK
ncbi:ABC transporter permease [Paenibacillus aceris]|uniref:Peptide/nickel transport system permease protein n=1 Tax=Paenibacillus aceris TaxID=869555 RepID=A0ABS4I259_9BACL|nr:ABC transporter permease [Paenibacillus aceris]MBP1964990.1 peptide/nickel transport system permease protein [Paenibacillus aceris]NHW35650.1 ABC transporter permease [Paenibacillus aceris]